MLLFVRALLQRRRSKTVVNNPIIKHVCAHEENNMSAFKKLALVTAMAALPMSGFAMEALDDATMSGVTGQDGITLSINLDNSLTLGIEDTDGFAGNLTSGLIIIEDMAMDGTANILIDAADQVLQIGVNIPSLIVNTGNISVGTGTDGTAAAAGLTNLTAEAGAHPVLIVDVAITLTDVDLNLQLGANASNLFAFSTANAIDIKIGTLGDASDSFTLNDLSASGGGALSVDELNINNVNLDGITGSVTAAGLVIETNTALAGIEVAAMGVKLGGAPSLGNVYITGLNMSGQTITISGH